MVRVAKRQNPRRAQVSRGASIPAPVGGWDARNPLAAMPISNAVILDNWIPRAGFVELRRGYISQMSDFTSPVETLMPFRGLASGDKLYACSGGSIYDATTAGTVGSAVLSGLTSNRWNYTSFATSSGEWTIACNGADAPIGCNGSPPTWAALPTMSGSSGSITLTPSNLFNVFSHLGRLYYLEKGTLHVWIPAAGAVGGACTLLDLSSIFNKGGRLICGGTWSYQFSVTADEFACFMTDQGQIAVYEGSDPTNANDWSLIGVFDFAPPLGPKALTKFGGDLVVVTMDGVMPLSQALKLDRSEQNEVALTSNIMNAFSAAARAYGSNFGWEAIMYPGQTPSNDANAPAGSLAIFNIPTAVNSSGDPTASMQFVQNVLTGAWCRFPGFAQGATPAMCWELANQCIYFGSTSNVFQWDIGSSDNGTSIISDVKSAFSNFGDGSREKQFTAIRPLLNTTPVVQPALDINVDYQEVVPTAVPTVVAQESTTPEIRYDWTSASGIGYVGAARMQLNLIGPPSQDVLGVGDSSRHSLAVDSSGDMLGVESGLPFDVPCQLLGFDILYQPGGQF